MTTRQVRRLVKRYREAGLAGLIRRKRGKPSNCRISDQVLARVDKDRVATTTRDLGLAESQIYAWRQRRGLEGLMTEE